MKKTLMMGFIGVFLFTHFTNAQVTKTDKTKEDFVIFNHISQYKLLDPTYSLDDQSEFKISDYAPPKEDSDNSSNASSTDRFKGMSGGETCVTYNFAYKPYGYYYGENGLAINPPLHSRGSYYIYGRSNIFTFPQNINSVTINVWDSPYSHSGATIYAYDQNGYYLGYISNNHANWGIVTYNAPAGKKIGSVLIRNRVWSSGNYYMQYMTTCANSNEAPVAIAQDVSVNADGNCQAVVDASAVNNGSYDPDGDALTMSLSPVGPYPTGITYVTLNVSDGEYTSTATARIIVEDNVPPYIEDLPDIARSNDPGVCGAYVELTEPTVSDNCGVHMIANNAPAIFPVGTTSVLWGVIDIHGNEASTTQVVVVIDSEDPVIEALSAVFANNDEGYCSAEIVLTAPIVTDNCGVASIENDAPTIFPVGITIVTWIATDIHGNSAEMMQDVVVTDAEAPILEGLYTMTQDNDPGVCGAVVAIPAPVVTDNCGVASIGNDAPTLFPIGITTVTWTATDIHGNSAMMTQEVFVNDTEAPILIVTTDVRTLWPVNHKYSTVSLSELLISATDNCSLDINGVFIMSVSSDEPEDAKGGGDGNTKKDILIADDCLSVDLRAERNGNGNGRVYTITLAVSDETGNESTAECYVQVPHSKKGTAINDGADAGYTIFSKCSNKIGFTFGEIDNPDYEDISLKTYPNPFAHTTEIEFYLPNESHVNLKIYDITGKLVHILIDRNFSTGLVRVTWDGSDNHGNKLNNGIYFAILQTRNGLARNSMIISR